MEGRGVWERAASIPSGVWGRALVIGLGVWGSVMHDIANRGPILDHIGHINDTVSRYSLRVQVPR